MGANVAHNQTTEMLIKQTLRQRYNASILRIETVVYQH